MDRPPHEEALSKAKIHLMAKLDSAFFTDLAFSLRHVFNDQIRTACTDGLVIEYNPEFFLKLDNEQRVFLILHEAMHCAYLHPDRVSERKRKLWNIACDHVINLQLLERGFKMPDGGLADPQYSGLSADEVYNRLLQQPDPPEDFIGEDLGDPTDNPDEHREAIEDILLQAALRSKQAGDKPGTIPGDIEIFLDRLVNPKLPWHRILQKWLQAFLKNDYSFKRPNRRFFPDHRLPSLWSQGLIDIAIAVDASGSVTDEEFNRFVSETSSILRMMRPQQITLIQFDTAIRSVDKVRNLHELMKVQFSGRGGTYIDPVIEWANQHKPQLLLVFSDGEFNFYGNDTKVPVLWIIHDRPQFIVPFGKVIHYEMKK